jgi:hypothetical protein
MHPLPEGRQQRELRSREGPQEALQSREQPLPTSGVVPNNVGMHGDPCAQEGGDKASPNDFGGRSIVGDEANLISGLQRVEVRFQRGWEWGSKAQFVAAEDEKGGGEHGELVVHVDRTRWRAACLNEL